MSSIRRRIRAVTLAWLLCQVASLSAFVPGECCVAHAAEAAAKEKAPACHEAAPVAPKQGDACPMHHGSKSHDCCAITNSCEGPDVQLASLFAYVGVLETPVVGSVSLESAPVAIVQSAPVLYRVASPDSPPPKS